MKRFWLAGEWLRRRYFVQDGYIRPVTGSRCEHFDPFDAYAPQKAAQGNTSIHLELAKLNWRSDRAIEEFCSSWGLLGLLWDREVQVRWKGPAGLLEYDLQDVKQTVQVRSEVPPAAGSVNEEAVVLRENDLGYLEEVPLPKHYQPYLPDRSMKGIRTWQDLHSQLTPTLVDHLCEPIAEFKKQASQFGACVRVLTRGKEPTPGRQSEQVHSVDSWTDEGALEALIRLESLDFEQGDVTMTYEQALNEVNRRTRRVHQCLQIDSDGKLIRAWVFPSLLSALYMMLLLDVTDGRLLSCKRCGTPFVPGHRRDVQEYCSPACRGAARKFRQRHPGEELRVGRKRK